MIGSRQKELLKTIVEEYVKTARPVGSKALCKKFKCSSATIRNDMMELNGVLETFCIFIGVVVAGCKYVSKIIKWCTYGIFLKIEV